MARRIRVLVIDADPGAPNFLESLLSRRRYRVFAVPDGQAALRTLDETRPDIVILELVQAGMGAVETLRQLKKRLLPEVPVIMTSGERVAPTIVAAIKLGATESLRKPFEAEELELTCQRALEEARKRRVVDRAASANRRLGHGKPVHHGRGGDRT